MQYKLTYFLGGERRSIICNFSHTVPPTNYISSWDNKRRSFLWRLRRWQRALGNMMPPAHLSKQFNEIYCALLTRLNWLRTNSFWKHEGGCVHENTTTPCVRTGAVWKRAWLHKPLEEGYQRVGLGVESQVCGSTPVSSSMWSFVLGNVVFASKVLIA